jgi:hypothetical protein
LNLPSDDFDVPLLIQTHGFNTDGTRYYTSDITNEFYGNSVSVNGKLWPFMTVEPRKYRVRIVNASNARSYELALVDQDPETAGPAFYQIGVDGGFLSETAVLNAVGTSLETELARYDRVLYLESAAQEDYLAHVRQNPNRKETWSEAQSLNEQTRKLWSAHPHMTIIKNQRSFDAKMSEVLGLVQAEIKKMEK